MRNDADNGLVRAKQLKTGTHGMAPVLGRVELIEDTPNKHADVPRYSDMASITLRPTAFSADHPAPANVRHGTVYDSGQKNRNHASSISVQRVLRRSGG